MGSKVKIYDQRPPSDRSTVFKSIYQQQLIELAEVRHPTSNEAEYKKNADLLKTEVKAVYVFYPWHDLVLECIPEEEFMELKTNRNQQLITKEEQKKLFNTNISVAGMSVGSSLMFGLVGSGFGKNLNIADDDNFSTSNLNRVQATLLDVGESKVEIASRRVKEMNPFVNVQEFSERISETNMDRFLFDGKADIIFEEIDDFRMKVLLREEAKKYGIPYVMLTNLGDSVMIDIERYDTQPETDLFNGKVSSDIIEKIKTSEVDQELMKQLSLALVDKDLVPKRAIKSLQEIGKTLVGRPQLYGTVALDGGIAPYITRLILLNAELSSGRYSLSLSEVFINEK